MLLDTGAEISVVDSSLVSEEHYLNGKMAVCGYCSTTHRLAQERYPKQTSLDGTATKSFETLRDALTSDTFLITPDPCKEFTLQTDASSRGVGAVLSQQNDDGILRPVAFYSRKLLDRETKYTITELECLAIVNTIKHFDVYLLGTHFLIQTDHSALKYLESLKHGSPRLMRWALSLQPFSYTVHHRKGTLNANADDLSRQAWDSPDLVPVTSLPKEGGVLGISSSTIKSP